MPFKFDQLPEKKRIYFTVATSLIVLALLIVVGSVWALLYSQTHQSRAAAPTPITFISSDTPVSTPGQTTTSEATVQPTATTSATTTATVASTATAAATPTVVVNAAPIGGSGQSMLFGTNLNLVSSNDQALTAPVAPLLKQMHVGMVRIPMRPGLSQATYVQAAQMIASIGAAPMVILETPEKVPSAISDDTQIIANMNKIFGSSTVYYEYGNEPNLGNGDPTWYIASWNKNVPAFRKLANNARFVGPVMYTYVDAYLSMFLTGVKQNPPDLVSWHEYTCGAAWTAAVCMQRLDNWAVHATSARAIMNSTLGTTLPIVISEWNYTAEHSVAGDGKNDNPAFMTAWTTKALQLMSANGIFAAMQYACTGTQIPLVDANNAITVQGTIFQKMG